MWARIANVLIGLWLMVAPSVFGDTGSASEISHRIAGPIVLSFAFISMWEVLRACRWVNFIAGLWLITAPFVLPGYETLSAINSFVCGLLVTAFAVPEGNSAEQIGGGWSALWRNERMSP